MGSVLGLGLSHYPPFSLPDEDILAGFAAFVDRNSLLSEEERTPAGWPAPMREEWGDDSGLSAVVAHRRAALEGFRRCRTALDEFEPDAIVIWGDDQYENFREDIIPPYAILALDDFEVRPWSQAAASSAMAGRPNVWGEPHDQRRPVRGNRDLAKYLIEALLDQGVDVSYAYRQLHHPGLPHAFLNAILYLDYDRRGFEYPIIPFPINCYGRRVISARGFVPDDANPAEPDPPSPRPDRLMEVGRATFAALSSSSWRVAVIASSSWSHAFLCDKTKRLHPDSERDHWMYERLLALDFDAWRRTSVAEIESAGQQELLNWFPLMGAVERAGGRLRWSMLVETSIFNSNKVFAVFDL